MCSVFFSAFGGVKRGLMRDELSEFMERGTVEKAVHPRAIADRISRLFRIVKDDGFLNCDTDSSNSLRDL